MRGEKIPEEAEGTASSWRQWSITALLLKKVEIMGAWIVQIKTTMEGILAPFPEIELTCTEPAGLRFIDRFFASTVLRVQQSGSKVRHGRTRRDVNRYLRRVYAKAVNTISRHMEKNSGRHMSQLYLQHKELLKSSGHSEPVPSRGYLVSPCQANTPTRSRITEARKGAIGT
ncbi:MAG: hypothetical protein QW512_04090 [Thermofilaceae archaeon]